MAYYKRRIKKTIKRSLTMFNFGVMSLCVLASLMIVSIGNATQGSRYLSSRKVDIVYSAQRLADAFDLYNEKRFSQ